MKKIVLIVLLTIIPVAASFAETASIADVKVDFSSGMVFSFVVKDAWTKGIDEAVASGIPTSFTFIVDIYRKKILLDEHVGRWRFNHTVKYDALKSEYEVTIGEKDIKELTKDRERMITLMTSGSDISISPMPAFKKGASYELRLKAELDKIELPFFFNYMFFFVKLWDFETGWYTHRFSF